MPSAKGASALLQPFAQPGEAIMRTRNHLHRDHLANLRGCGSARIDGCFHARHVAAEKGGHVAAADFFPTGEIYICGLKGGVGCFKQGAEPLRFDHSNCLLSHKFFSVFRIVYFLPPAGAWFSPRKTFPRSSCGRAMTWEATSSPTLLAALEPASTAAFTLATSPRQMTVMRPPPMVMVLEILMFAAFAMASVASMLPV